MGDENDDTSSALSLTQGPSNVGWCDGSFSEEEETSDAWEDVKDAFTVVTFDEATHDSWEAAKTEICIVRNNILQILHLHDFADYTLSRLLDYIFGPASSLWVLIDSNLNGGAVYSSTKPLRHEVFKKIIGAFFVASSLGVSTCDLWKEPVDEDGKAQSEVPGTKGRCAVCKTLTRYFCTSCHHWLCGPSSSPESDDGRPVTRFMDLGDNRIYFRQSCWHVHHENGLKLTAEKAMDE